MSKYEKRQGHGMSGNEVMGYVLEEIRNELEESNRLKRLELQQLCDMTGKHPTFKDLEDKA